MLDFMVLIIFVQFVLQIVKMHIYATFVMNHILKCINHVSFVVIGLYIIICKFGYTL
jgi:hypothetical protein